MAVGSESWTAYKRQEHRLNSYHMRCLRRIFGISWKEHVPNKDVLEQANMPSMNAFLTQRRLRWLGHVHRMQHGRIPKVILYGELATESRPAGRPLLCFRDVCKGDLKSADISVDRRKETASDHCAWRKVVRTGSTTAVSKLSRLWSDKKERRKAAAAFTQPETSALVYMYSNCSKDFHSRIGLFSHSRRCSSLNSNLN